MENILPIITALILLAFGILFAYLALRLTIEQIRAWAQAHQSLTWASVQGVIQTSEITLEGVRSPRSQPHVIYTYQVNGTTYQGSRINFTFAGVFSNKEATAILASYSLHTKVTVYYDPARPAESTLEQRHTGILGGLMLGMLVFLPTCLCLATGIIGMTDALRR